MSSLVKFAIQATIGILVNKGRDLEADKLKQGNVTNRKLHDMIVGEITDVKSKLDGLARKDLLAAIEYFEEGLVLFDDAFHSKIQLCSNTEAETVFSGQAMGKLKLSDLDESATVLLCNAKKRFQDARRKASECSVTKH